MNIIQRFRVQKFKKNSIFRNLGRYMEFKMGYFIPLTESNISFSVQLKIQLNFGLSVSRKSSRSQPKIPTDVLNINPNWCTANLTQNVTQNANWCTAADVLNINPFHVNGRFLYLMKTSENLRDRKRPVAWNGLLNLDAPSRQLHVKS